MTTIGLLDRFVRKSELSALQRYEGLALRAIAYDQIERLLATPADEILPCVRSTCYTVAALRAEVRRCFKRIS